MSITRVLALSIATRGRRGLVAAFVTLCALVLLPGEARAANFEITLTAAESVTVGQTGLTAHVTLRNTSDQREVVCNTGECIGQDGILVLASCAALAELFPECSIADDGVFKFAPVATLPLGSSCGEDPLLTTFDVIDVNPPAQGKLRLVPRGRLALSAAGVTSSSCDISLAFDVVKQPTTDADLKTDGSQTQQLATATAQFTTPVGGFPQETSASRHTVTVGVPVVPPPTQPPPVVPPPVVPPPVVVPPPIAVPPPPPPAVIQPTDLDHFKCYEALQTNFRQRTLGLRDQFGQRRARVIRARQLCNPVSKNGAKILQPRAHLVCYETRDTGNPTPPRTVLVTNQFGQRKLTTTRPSRLCVPSLKRKPAGAVPTAPDPTRLLDHFRCYDVQPQPAARTVKLADQFGTTSTKVLRVIRLCNPVRKNNEPVRRAKSHLVCYSITDAPKFRPLAVRVRNQFGQASLRVRRPETLCLPSFKKLVNAAGAEIAEAANPA